MGNDNQEDSSTDEVEEANGTEVSEDKPEDLNAEESTEPRQAATPEELTEEKLEEVAEDVPPQEMKKIMGFMKQGVHSPPSGPDRLLENMPEEDGLEALEKILDSNIKKIEKHNEDRRDERRAIERQELRRMIFVGGAYILLIGVGVFCLITGFSILGNTIISASTGLLIGGIGGYGFGRSE